MKSEAGLTEPGPVQYPSICSADPEWTGRDIRSGGGKGGGVNEELKITHYGIGDGAQKEYRTPGLHYSARTCLIKRVGILLWERG